MFNGLKVKIMKKKVLFAAMALVALASCSSDEIASLSSPPESTITDPETSGAIVFSSASKGITRADITGADAATLLGGKFVVSGKKGSTTAATNGNIVFDNYLVEWTENTAHTTESNTTNWEYVQKDRIQHAIDHGITSQTIKYWDYSQPQYDFIAWSTGSKTAIYVDPSPADIPSGNVLVSAINPNATATKAYTFKGKAEDLRECYIADLVTVKKADYGDNPVTFKFRQLGTKVRIGIYETVPGYSVKDVKFYSAAAVDLVKAGDAKPESGTYTADEAAEENASAKIFTTVANDILTEGTYTITFPTVDSDAADNNQAHVTFEGSGDQKTTVDWGGLNYTIAEEGEKNGTQFLGRTSNTASFAGDANDNYYVVYLPNETGTNLNLRVDYTLESIDGSGEEINVRGATAQVPLIYTQWKPGFAYTYLFKISDKTNGHTGVYDPTHPDDTSVNSDPAGLYPITFDAYVVNAEEDKTQETITLVATPSITTYQKGSKVVNNNEYLAATGPIFVTVNDGEISYETVTTPAVDVSVEGLYKKVGDDYILCGSSEVSDGTGPYYRMKPIVENGALATLTGKAALYTIPAGKTEADVIDALQMRDDDNGDFTIKGRSGLGLKIFTSTLVNSVEYGADGNAISVGTDQALRFTPSANTYAFVYTKTAPTTDTDKFQPVTMADGASVSGLYRYALTAAPAGDMQKGVKYFPNVNASAGMITAFLGQGVGNLYLDDAGNTIASGYAVTGTTYYYSYMDGPIKKYKAAYNLAYEDFASTTLYKDQACTIEFSTEEKADGPVDGTAYYYIDGSDKKYCVILPQQTTGYYVINEATAKVSCGSTTAVNGMTYFDKYTQNNGVYYTKIIKVQ